MDERSCYYRYHLFFCCNQRDGVRECCANKGAVRMRDYCKQRVRTLGLNGPGKVRVNLAGCMDRCSEGPVLVIYPDGVWYRYQDERDLDAIITAHLLHGVPVDHLRI